MWQKIKGLISIIILILLFWGFCKFYNSFNFNEFVKSEAKPYTSTFSRDNNEKYNNINSYKIESKNYNDAIFSKKINVEKNTVYRVSCKVKTKDVIQDKEVSSAGAHICIVDTVEKSESIIGTNDNWQEIELLFNSKNRDSVDIGFRLGGYEGECKGEAWFTDFKIESGIVSDSTNWKFVCFVFENINVNIENNGKSQNVNLTMNSSDLKNVEENMSRFATTCRTLSRI